MRNALPAVWLVWKHAGAQAVRAGAVVGDVLLQFAYALASAALSCPRPPRVSAVSRGHIAVYFD
jgi:hypothetical protein